MLAVQLVFEAQSVFKAQSVFEVQLVSEVRLVFEAQVVFVKCITSALSVPPCESMFVTPDVGDVEDGCNFWCGDEEDGCNS